jgi:hypothetical protein
LSSVVHGTVRSLFQLLGAIGVTLLVVAAGFAYRLSEGPLSLSFLTPYIEGALTLPGGPLTVKLDRTILLWSGQSHNLEIRAENVRALADQTVVASVPEMSLSLSGRALLQGIAAPRSLRLLHPTIHVRRDLDGRTQFGLGDGAEPEENGSQAAQDVLRALLSPPDGAGVAGELRRIEVVGAELQFDDLAAGKQWRAPRADFGLLRDRQGVVGHAHVDVDVEGQDGHLDLDGGYRIGQPTIDARLSFGGVRPAVFAGLAPPLQPLVALQLPVSGQVALQFGLDGQIADMRFDMTGGEGAIGPAPGLSIGLPAHAVRLKGELSEHLTRLALDEATIDLGGPVLTLSGHAEGLGTAMTLEATARVDDLPVDSLKDLWPAELAPHPRAWIVTNLSHGRVRYATAKLAAHLPPGQSLDGLIVDQLTGELAPEGVTVQYMPSMPPVNNASGLAHYDADSFVIDIKQGEAPGLTVSEGQVRLLGLSKPAQSADIKLKIGGTVASALRLIDNKPLGWATKLGVDPAQVKGDAVTLLTLHFPLLANLSFDQLKVHALAQTTRLAMAGLPLGLDLAEGDLSLDVDPSGMEVTGKGRLGGAPATIRWRENFTKSAAFRSRYQVALAADDQLRKTLGLDVAPFQPPFMTGPVPVEVVAQLAQGGKGDITVTADLTPAAMRLPGLNWDKPAGTGGRAQALLRLAGGRLAEVPHFAVGTANGLAVEGSVGFDNGQARRVTFDRAKWGRTEVSGRLTIRPDHAGLGLEVSGSSFDARELVSNQPSEHQTDKAALHGERPPKPPAPRQEVTPLTVQARFARTWLSDDGVARNVSAALTRDTHDWQQARVDGLVGPDNKPLHIEIQPQPDHRRSFKMSSPDAGSVFRCFDVFNNVVGGQLNVEGVYDDNDPQQPLTGLAKVTDYQVVQAPALARLLSVAALTGIVEVLAGDGIHFSTMEAPFTLTDGVLALHDARAYGTSLGITAKGQVDLDNDVLALEGTVVPMYALNAALGQIPLVGSLFAAEKGGGIVAMNYSMKGPTNDPDVTVNPLSALTPGFLRKLFNIFDDGSGTEVRPKAPELPKAPTPATE